MAHVAAVRRQGKVLDRDLDAWTARLSRRRVGLMRLTRGRMAPMVRALQVAGAIARIAVLWRTPAR